MTSPAWRVVPAEPVAWLVKCSNGFRSVGLSNAIADFRTIDPEATVQTLCATEPRPDYDALAAEVTDVYYRRGGTLADALRAYFEGKP